MVHILRSPSSTTKLRTLYGNNAVLYKGYALILMQTAHESLSFSFPLSVCVSIATSIPITAPVSFEKIQVY